MTHYSLPGGKKKTKSIRRYIKTWVDIAKPIEKATGSNLRGFNPGFAFGSNDTQSFELPASVTIKISAALLKGPQ